MICLILYPFPWLNSRCFSKDWDVTEYGVCELIDIVSEIPDTTICLSQQDSEMVICIPKRGMLTLMCWKTVAYLSGYLNMVSHILFPAPMVPAGSMEGAV